MQLTSKQVKDIISPSVYDDAKLQKIADSLNQTFTFYHIDSELRICHFLAQVLHESSAFRYTVEIWGNTDYQKRYDTRTDLGNTPEEDGDGYLYRGRGWIQLTGKANYIAAGTALSQDFVNKPDLVQEYPWVAMVSGWYWNSRNLNKFADADDINTVTKLVNGGYLGLDDRKMWLSRAKNFIMQSKPSSGLLNGKVAVDALNIRESGSATAELVAQPLVRDTNVTILEESNGWLKVRTGVEGWVKKDYIQINN